MPRMAQGGRKMLKITIFLTIQLLLSQERYALAAGDDAVEGAVCILPHTMRVWRRELEADILSIALYRVQQRYFSRCVMSARILLCCGNSSTTCLYW